jgi:hypothetical protein
MKIIGLNQNEFSTEYFSKISARGCLLKSSFKYLVVFVFLVFAANTAMASPRTSRSKSSRSKSSSRAKAGSSKLLGNTSGKPNSYFSGITNHEAAAERQKEIDKAYAEQQKAIKEGRPIPKIAGASSKAQEIADRRAALEEKRAKRAEEMELRRLEREAKKDERLAAAAERKAKKQERLASGKKKVKDDLPDVESEIAKKPKVKPAEPEKLEGF